MTKVAYFFRLLDQIENRILFARLHNCQIAGPLTPAGPFGDGGIGIGVDHDHFRAFGEFGGKKKSGGRFSRATLGLNE
jgi:hypothetical protein